MPKEAASAQHVQAYKDAVDNIIFFKRQQWQISNYAFFTQAALYILSRQVPAIPKLVFVGLSLITGAAAVAFLWFLQRSMDKMRERLAYIYNTHFEPAEREAMRLEAGERSDWRGWWRERFATVMLSVACGLAAIVTMTVICLSPPSR